MFDRVGIGVVLRRHMIRCLRMLCNDAYVYVMVWFDTDALPALAS